MKKKFEDYIREAANKNRFDTSESISGLRKIKAFKDVQEYKVYLDKEFKNISSKMEDIEDYLFNELVFTLAELIASPIGIDEDDNSLENAHDDVNIMFGELHRAFNNIDLNKIKAKTLSLINKNISKKHEMESKEASERIKSKQN